MATKLVKQGSNALLINTTAGRLDVGTLLELVRVGTLTPDQMVSDERRRGAVAKETPKSSPVVGQKATPSFTFHMGSNLRISGVENLSRLPKADLGPKSKAHDPFQGLPLYGLAEYLGDRVMPVLETAKKEQMNHQRQAKLHGESAEVVIPYIPALLPVTRWASQDAQFRSTLVVDESSPQKARLSWYHPEDTMVPREWFSKGLLEDLKYYSPFGWFASSRT
jgi:hypothetical protein